jgi:hypothetical protein
MTHASIGAWAATVGLVVLLEAPAASVQAGSGNFPPPGSLHYVILRDGDPVGFYEMDFARDGNRFRVRTHTDITVSFLGIVLYHLQSSSDEVWVDGRLQHFHATSDDGGKPHEVAVRPRAGEFDLVENGVEHFVSGDLLPGTLWHPATLTATELIDPIDCQRNKVRVVDRGMEQITVQGRSVPAHHVAILEQRALDVWYAAEGRILAMSYRAWDDSLIKTELR